MSDAKSRYEIVESLTEQKQSMIDQISNLESQIKSREFNIGQLERQQKRELEEKIRKDAERIEDEQAALEVFKKDVDSKIDKLTEKKGAYEEAIEAIKAISANNEKVQ